MDHTKMYIQSSSILLLAFLTQYLWLELVNQHHVAALTIFVSVPKYGIKVMVIWIQIESTVISHIQGTFIIFMNTGKIKICSRLLSSEKSSRTIIRLRLDVCYKI
ncbi:unnamed protein product [Adineta ricciae]|uniref:Uncharacterized protein n=1 Tax=Adineta ricciae TaxID=249248 RepID=A0A813YIB6_ADIRI|nr:unnamed protein product [Adineta ricciae]